MLEDGSGCVFGIFQVRRTEECVDLDGKACITCMKMSHHQAGVLVDEGIGFQEIIKVPAEKTKVGHCAGLRHAYFPVQTFCLKAGDEFLPGKADSKNVDVHLSFQPPPPCITHASPVLEGIGDKHVSRNTAYRIVEIANLYGNQGNIQNGTIGIVFRHRDPVAYMQHFIVRKLHSRHKTQQGVLEDQHQHSAHCTEACKEGERRLAYQYRN